MNLKILEQNNTNSKDSLPKPRKLQSIEEKRRKGRLRSKTSRDRRKNYISTLENRVKSLERENFRLQSIIMKYRKENWENIDEASKSFITESIKHRTSMVSKHVDFDTMEYKKDSKISIRDDYKANLEKMVENHRKLLDGTFDVLINHAYPISKYSYWKHFDKEYTRDYESLKKFEKLTKYKTHEFLEEKEFNEIDQFMLSLKPNKRQFEYLK